MLVIRRIYVYLLAAAGLAMLAAGAAHLLQLAIEFGLGDPRISAPGYVRASVAWWGAAAVVGLPVWLLHWRAAQRLAQASPAEHAAGPPAAPSAGHAAEPAAEPAVDRAEGHSAERSAGHGHESFVARSAAPSAELPAARSEQRSAAPSAEGSVQPSAGDSAEPAVARAAARAVEPSAERVSTLRRLYVYAVMAVSLAAAAGAACDLLRSGIAWALAAVGSQASQVGQVGVFGQVGQVGLAGQAGLVGQAGRLGPVLDPLPWIVVGGLVWFGHWRLGRADRRAAGEVGGSATLRRWYVYGAALVGFSALLDGSRETLDTVWHLLAGPAPHAPAAAIAGPVAVALVGLGVWLGHWSVIAADTLDDDRPAVLRSVYLFAALAIGVVGALLGASQLLYYALGRLVGIEHPGGVGGSLLAAAAGPTSTLLVYGAGWAYQRQAIRAQGAGLIQQPQPPLTPDMPRTPRRVYTYLVALVALVLSGSGTAGLLWSLADWLLGAPGWTAGDGVRDLLVLYATLLLVGLPVWLGHWRAQARDDAGSFARRLYAYVAVSMGMLTLLASSAVVVYRVIELALGEAASPSTRADLAHAAAVAVVAGAIAAYHWSALRQPGASVRFERAAART